MRFLTKLRRLDNSKKDTLILFSSIFLTMFIVLGGIFYARLLTEKKEGVSTNQSTSTLNSLLQDIKTSIIPTISEMKQNVSDFSNEYKKGSFKDFFVPKSE